MEISQLLKVILSTIIKIKVLCCIVPADYFLLDTELPKQRDRGEIRSENQDTRYTQVRLTGEFLMVQLNPNPHAGYTDSPEPVLRLPTNFRK